MSDFTSIVTKAIQKDYKNNFKKVLIDMAKAFENSGFFEREDWKKIMDENFHPNVGSAIQNKNVTALKNDSESYTLAPIATRTRRRTMDHNAERFHATPKAVQQKTRLNQIEIKSKTSLNKSKPIYHSPTRRSLRLHTVSLH